MSQPAALNFPPSIHTRNKSSQIKIAELKLNPDENYMKRKSQIAQFKVGRVNTKRKIIPKMKEDVASKGVDLFELSVENFKNKIFRKRNKFTSNTHEISNFEENYIESIPVEQKESPILRLKPNRNNNKKLTPIKIKMTPIEDKETSIDLVELYKKCEKDEALNCNRIDFDNLLKTSDDANQNSTENKNPTQQMKQDTKAEGTHCGHLIKWKRGEKLKESSHSIIWRALNIITGATLVVKQVKTRDLYDTEVKNYSTIGTHKNILEFLGNEIFDNQMYIYLEYASGGSISDIISKYEGLNPNLVRLYLKQTTEAVVHLHKCGITHNDINPSCILLNERGIIKISNFSKANTTQSYLKDIITNLINQFTLTSNRINTDELFIYLQREYGNMEDLN